MTDVEHFIKCLEKGIIPEHTGIAVALEID
jgi:hypothetical protein